MEQIITEIEQSMVNLLDNMEMEELHNVLVNTLCGLTIIENKNNKNSCEKDYCDMFICAKRVEGCSEKTIKYYKSTIDSKLLPLIKYIVKLGNVAVHTNANIKREEAVLALHNLHEFVAWIDYCYVHGCLH